MMNPHFSIRVCFLLLLVLFHSGWISGNTGFPFSSGDGIQKVPFTIPKTSQSVHVDGVLNEEAWIGALVLNLEYEVEPGENVPPPEKTECLITYNDHYFLAAFRCFDSQPGLIRANYSDRDQIMTDDRVLLQLDTFNDERRSFVFACNPLGIQWDVIRTNENWDSSWDAIWDCAGKIYDWGYVVEFAIPFDQLRFKKAETVQVWGFDANRVLPRSLEHVIGAVPRDRSNNCYHCQMLKIQGFEEAVPGRNLELAPTLTGVRTDVRDDLPEGDFRTQNQKADLGLTAKWGLTTNITLQGAVNPDFSQVEADALQLDINQPFALYFREKRPFFTEGGDYFETLGNRHIEGRINPVYTRSIRDPIWGLKLTGKEGENTFGAFFIRDRITNIIFPGHEVSRSTSLTESNAVSAARYRRDIGSKYSFGALFTGRESGDYFNRVFGLDGDLRISDRDRVVVQVLGSSTRYPSGIGKEYGQREGEFSDLLWMAHYKHDTRNYRFYADYHSVGTDFRADLGFVPRADYSKAEVGLGYTWWGEAPDFLNRIILDANYDQTQRLGGGLMEREIELTAAFLGPWRSMAFVYYGARERIYENLQFNQDFKGINISIQPSGKLLLGTWLAFEDKIDYSQGRPASELMIFSNADVNLNRHFSFSLNHIYQNLGIQDGRLFWVNSLDTQFKYQFNRRAFFRAILQYAVIDRNQTFYTIDVDQRSTSLFSQLLFSYKLNPRTVLFAGYSDNHLGTREFKLAQADRTVFVKFGYAWTH